MAEIGFVPLAAGGVKYKEGTIVLPANDTAVRSIDVGFTIKLLIFGDSNRYEFVSSNSPTEQIVWNPEKTSASNTAKAASPEGTSYYRYFYVSGSKIYYFSDLAYSEEGSIKWSAYGI